jgi:hypothetical protein
MGIFKLIHLRLLLLNINIYQQNRYYLPTYIKIIDLISKSYYLIYFTILFKESFSHNFFLLVKFLKLIDF